METPQVEYELTDALTGKADRKEPVILEDNEGHKMKAPWAPKKNCKRCYGRGYVGRQPDTKELIPCRKCYPWR